MSSTCTRPPRRTVRIDRIPKGAKIIDCGHVYVAKLADGAAVVTWNHHGIEAESRLRRAVISGKFAGVKRRRLR
jgi:hypothetical protein